MKLAGGAALLILLISFGVPGPGTAATWLTARDMAGYMELLVLSYAVVVVMKNALIRGVSSLWGG